MKTLVIDDEPFLLKLIAHQLDALGFTEVAAYQHAGEALAYLETTRPGVELVLCDLQMPEVDGIEVVRRLASLGFSGSLVLISGENDRVLKAAELVASAQHLNVLGVLRKPPSLEQMRSVLQRSAAPPATAARAAPKSHGAAELRSAIAAGELFNVYQPKVDVETGAVVGVESLVRWHHRSDGVIFPDQFIALAEESGLIDALTIAVLTTALRQARLWKDIGIDVAVAVNVSMDNLRSLSFPDRVAREVSRSGLNPSSLILEVTESRVMKDRVAALDILTRLRLKRIRLSIDDFGTGHSSLAQLRDLPFDELKIDRSFVHAAHRSPPLRGIVEGSLGMARMIGMQTVAEGVEDRDDWDFARLAGCGLAQGYFIARPMPGDELPRWISGWLARRSELGIDTPSTWAMLAEGLASAGPAPSAGNEDLGGQPSTDRPGQRAEALAPITAQAPPPFAPLSPAGLFAVHTPDQSAQPPDPSLDWLQELADQLAKADAARQAQSAREMDPSPFAPVGNATSVPSGAAILDEVLLAHAPIVDRLHRVTATRLTVMPLTAHAVPDAGSVLDAVSKVWADGKGTVSLNVASDRLLHELLRSRPPANVMIELPTEVARDPAHSEAIRALGARGNTLVLKGWPTHELPPVVMQFFKWSIVDVAGDRRIGRESEPASVQRTMPAIHVGVQTMAQFRRSFKSGAVAVIGWPLDGSTVGATRPELSVMLELANRIDHRDAAALMERTLVRDTALTFALLRQIRAGAAPSDGEPATIQQSIARIGHEAMRRWLAHAMADASDGGGLRPMNFVALRRAILMHQLASAQDPRAREEMFLCGLCSVVGQVTGRPVADVLASIDLPERVRWAVGDSSGPLYPWLELARAIDSQFPERLRHAVRAVSVEPQEINRAVIRSLRLASVIERPSLGI